MTEPQSIDHPAPLHAADWRFLLPRPPAGQFEHLVLLGGPWNLAKTVIEIGLTREVSETAGEGRLADAVVVLRGAGMMLPEAGRCLSPGGVLYYEIDRSSPSAFLTSTPRRIRQSLREVGLTLTARYAVVPDFVAHQMYLPLDTPGALRWYVATLFNAFSPWQQLLKFGLQAATGLDGRRLIPFAPRIALTAVKGTEGSSVPSVLQLPGLPPELQRPSLRPLLLTSGGDRVVVLPFADDSSHPAAVLKVPRLPGFNDRTDNEQATLRRLWSRLDHSMRHSIPRPLGIIRAGDVSIGVESYAPGQLLSCSSERWGASTREKLDDLLLAAAWLQEFHVQTQVCLSSWGASELFLWVETPFRAYRDAFGLTDDEDRLFTLTRGYAGLLSGTPFPVVLQHRDFTVWNLSRAGRELAVLDWEGSRPGPALCDLLRFVIHWYETVRHAHDETSRQYCFRRLFFEHDDREPLRAAIFQTITRYIERLRMSRQLLPVLLVYLWVELALRRRDQQTLQGGTRCADPRSANRYVPFVAILAQHADQLFVHGPLPDLSTTG